MKTFTNKDGQQSAYALACGYIQAYTTENAKVELYQEHGAYHVRYIPAGSSVYDTGSIWEVFDTLTPARKCYASMKTRA